MITIILSWLITNTIIIVFIASLRDDIVTPKIIRVAVTIICPALLLTTRMSTIVKENSREVDKFAIRLINLLDKLRGSYKKWNIYLKVNDVDLDRNAISTSLIYLFNRQ